MSRRQRFKFDGDGAGHKIGVYLAGPWTRREEYLILKEEIENSGMYFVTSRWLEVMVPEKWSDTDPLLRGYSRWKGCLDMADVSMSVICIFDMRGILEDERPRHGTHTELGAALAYGKAVWIVGERNHVFHYMPSMVHFDTMEEAIDERLGYRSNDL